MTWNGKADLGPLFRPPPENRHKHSGIALEKLAREDKLRPREKSIMRILALKGPMADRRIQLALLLPERNSVSPRITELIRRRFVVEVSSEIIEGHRSRVVSLTAAGLQWLREQQ